MATVVDSLPNLDAVFGNPNRELRDRLLSNYFGVTHEYLKYPLQLVVLQLPEFETVNEFILGTELKDLEGEEYPLSAIAVVSAQPPSVVSPITTFSAVADSYAGSEASQGKRFCCFC